MGTRTRTYGPEAYAPTGELWWRCTTYPGSRTRFGDTPKLAAWLACNKALGDTFTMRDLREVLGDGNRPNAKEHLNRRLRELRAMHWDIRSKRHDDTLPVDAYRVSAVGWHPGTAAERPGRQRVSGRLRREVLERDWRRCVVCGVATGEPYPGEPGTHAVMTVGHRVPALRTVRARSSDELQAECQRCNETIRDQLRDPATYAETLPLLRALSGLEKDELSRWLRAGHRLRSRLDEVYDKVRVLSPAERDKVAEELARMLGQRRGRQR